MNCRGGPISKPAPFRSPGTAWAIALLVAMLAGAQARADLRSDVRAVIDGTNLGSATVAVSIRDSGGGELVQINHRRLMTPASNMKLLTTGAALVVLGPQFQFQTRLLHDGNRLVVVGDGDPGFGDPDLLRLMDREGGQGLSVDELLRHWIDAVVNANPSSINEIVVDDRVFDRQLVHDVWPANQLVQGYCAEVSGLNFHLNVLHFFPRPDGQGAPIFSDFQPYAPWVERINKATGRTGASEQSNPWINRPPMKNAFTLHGNVKFTHRAPVAVTVHDMPNFFGELLMRRLREAGMTVGEHRRATGDERFAGGTPIGPTILTPISTAVTRCNRDSQNLYAEALLKRIGHQVTGQPGSWTNGSAVLRHVLLDRLKDPSVTDLVIVSDGSGLSRDNRVAATTLTAWMHNLSRDPRIGPVFIESLAIGGTNGTLKKRFRGVDLGGASVQAKSGFINEVSCLSGYVTAPNGRRRSFSILINGLDRGGSVRLAKRVQEQIVAAIAQDMLTRSPLSLGSDRQFPAGDPGRVVARGGGTFG